MKLMSIYSLCLLWRPSSCKHQSQSTRSIVNHIKSKSACLSTSDMRKPRNIARLWKPSLNYLMKQRKMLKMAMKSLRSFQLCNSFRSWRIFSRDSSDAIPMLIVKSLIFETRYVRLVKYSVFKCLHPTIQYQNMSISHSKHFGARTYVRGYPKQ